MNRVDATFEQAKSEGKTVLVTYLCAGDPDVDSSFELAMACVEAGADILELGCPFSDPCADGPAIARASQRALERGGGLMATLRIARAIRDRADVPIVLFGYYNPLFVRGDEQSAQLAADAGVDALLVVDLPVDESMSLRQAAAAHSMGLIPLVTPTTTPERTARIGTLAESFPVPFVYCVSTTGVTGGTAATTALRQAAEQAKRTREVTKRPTVIGFGIEGPEQARVAATGADGVVVGSALVRRIEGASSQKERLESVRHLVRELRAAL